MFKFRGSLLSMLSLLFSCLMFSLVYVVINPVAACAASSEKFIEVGSSVAATSDIASETPTAITFSILDDSGQLLRLERPAQRIVLLYGGFEELLSALGESARIVGRTDSSTNTDLVKVPSIGTHMRPNFELVLALRPDLVLQMQSARGESQESVQRLRELGLNVAVFRLESFADIFSVLERLATLLDVRAESTGDGESSGSRNSSLNPGLNAGQNRGTVLAASMRASLESLDKQISQTGKRPTVFFELRYPNLLGAGAGSLPNEIINRAGGHNVLEGSAQRLVKLDEEEILRLDPDVYIMQQGPMYKQSVPLEQRPVLKALTHARTLVVEGTEYLYPGLHSVDAVFELARFLHPDLVLDDSIIK